MMSKTYELADDVTVPWFYRPATVVGACVVAAVVAAAILVPVQVQASEHQAAVELFERAVADRDAVYADQGEAVDELHTAEATLTEDYPTYVAVASTLADGTVADPATRAGLLSAASEYAKTDLALDGAGVFVAERPDLYDELVRERLVEAEVGAVSEFSAKELRSQAAVLEADTELTRSYIDLVQETTARIEAAAGVVASRADAVIVSAAEKGVTLTWAKAPAETAAVVAAAKALVPEKGTEVPLVDRAALVSAYATSVTAAAAAQKAVLDREAEAARQAAAEEAERQAAAQRQQWNNQGSSTPASRGSTGGTSPSTRSVPPGGVDT